MENVSRETILMQQYVDLLIKWNKRINLIGKSTLDDMYERHILDSKQLITFIGSEDKIIDIGSGAGLPGIILSLCGVKHVTLVESDSRKAAFLTQASMLSPNKVEVINRRVENIDVKADILVARAFASINDIMRMCSNIKVQKMLLLKGQRVKEEIEEALKYWDFEYKLHPSQVVKNSWITEIRRAE